jgi:hypothetical protein
MTVVVAWLLFPLVLGLACLGCGLLVEAAAGSRLPTPLVLPVGLTAVVVIAQFATATSATAKLALPAVVVAAVAGVALGRPWRSDWRDHRWPLAAAAGVFAVFAAPVVLSGQATFAGYIKLDDTATWFALTDRVMSHGRSVSGLPVSTYFVVLRSYLGGGYPVGSFLPLGIGHEIVRTDIAWLFQPYLAFLAAMVSLALYWVARAVIPSRRLAALAAFAAPLAATLYGYSLWGGAKEMMAAVLVTLTAALAADAVKQARTGRQLLPLAVAAAAAASALSAGAAIWLGPLLLGALLIGFRFQRRDLPLRQAAVFVPLAVLLTVPALGAVSSFVGPGAEKTLTSGNELGNLSQPLKFVQAFGIWPTGDFRTNPVQPVIAYALIGVLALALALGLAMAVRRRSWELPLLVVGVFVGLVIVVHFGSPWVDGKALATAAPVFVLGGMVGAAMIFSAGRRIEGALIGLAILLGVLWSDALAFRDVSLAPKPQLAELEHIAGRIHNQGPTLMTDYEPYGVRHFLRNSAPEGASEFRWRQVTLRDGTLLPKGQSADLDRFQLQGILVYRNLVIHRSPAESRPPAPYSLTWRGKYFELWQRPAGAPRVLVHLPLGDGNQPGAVPPCANILTTAVNVPVGGRLAAVIRTPPTIVSLGRSGEPPGWTLVPSSPDTIIPGRAGSLDVGALVRQSGNYSVWLGGSFSARVRIYVDGKLVGSRRQGLEWEQYQPFGSVHLDGGRVHDIRLTYDGRSLLHPGSGDTPTAIGPILLGTQADDVPVTYLRASQARSLCGKYLDWVEALG